MNEVDRITRVALRRPQEAFAGPSRVAGQWRSLGYAGPPHFEKAVAEFERLCEIIAAAGARIELLPGHRRLTLDSIYVRDALVATPTGVILCRMGKAARHAEPRIAGAALEQLEMTVQGGVTGTGRLEGGDVVWLDAGTVLVGEGYRTNAEGIRQLAALLGEGVELHRVALPHWNGEDDVFHLMSMLSPVDHDLALVYGRLLPVPLRRFLLDRGVSLVEVPDEEFESMACNVLALAPRRVVMIAGARMTRRKLERAGVDVEIIEGAEIARKGFGGPTCLTRPLARGGSAGT